MLMAVKIILVLVLIALVVVVIGVWWFINKVKTAFKDALSGMTVAPPCRVTLQPESHPEWRNGAKIKQYSDDFAANGFTPLGAFSLPELPSLRLAAFVNEAENLFGIAYDHEKLPPNFDVVCRYEDGTDLTVTNTTYASAMDRPPGSPAIRLEGVGVREALDAAWKHPASAPRIPARCGDFAGRFESAYAQEMNWRMSRGGVTREEVRRQAEKKGGDKITDEQLDEVYENQRAAYIAQLQAGCIAQYKREQKPAPAEWEEIEHRVFAIPEVFTEAEVLAEVEANLSLDEEQSARLQMIKLEPGQTALDFMNQALTGKAGPLTLAQIGSVQEPVPARLFLREESKDDSGEPKESDDE